MHSRIKQQVNHLFDCFLELQPAQLDSSSNFLPPNGVHAAAYPQITPVCRSTSTSPESLDSGCAVIVKRYPASYEDEEMLRSVSQFCFPCPQMHHENITHFSFVLTAIDSRWTFGFCRHLPAPDRRCLLLLSSLPWHDTFFKLLNHLSALIQANDLRQLQQFLRTLYYSPVPRPGQDLHLQYSLANCPYEYRIKCIDSNKIASIPEDRNLTEYLNAFDARNMCRIFAALLNERRILITSNRISRLTGCVQAANQLLYPMQWQHIFIPILPKTLIDYINAPMPYLIGVPSTLIENIPAPDLDEVVLVDADRNTVTSPFDDVHRLPLPVISFLKKSLKRKSDLLGDRVSRVFLRASVMLLGGYRDALRLLPGQQITFHDDQFVRSRPTSWRPFLRQMLHLQTFRQFIDQRLQLLNAGSGLDDEFERDLNSASAELGCHNTQFSHQYKHWVSQVKRDGGAVLRSVQPVFRTAYRRLKDQSRRAVHGLRDRMITSDSNHPHHSSSHHHRNHLNPHIRSASSEHLSGIRPDQVPQSLLFGSLSLSSSSQQSSPLSSHGSSFASSLPMPTQNISTKVRSPIRSCSLDLLHLDSSRDLISFHT